LTEAYLQEVIPLAEYQRRRHDLEQKQQALKTQQTQLEAQGSGQIRVHPEHGMSTIISSTESCRV
jgi:hypothetical protein